MFEMDESNNQIECPRCGAKVFYELTSCPECGQSFYPAEWEESDYFTELPQSSLLNSLGAVLVGWLSAFVVAFLFYRLLLSGSPQSAGLVWRVSRFLAGPLCAFGGGYLAALTARREPVLHGLVCALLVVGSVILLESVWYESLWMMFMKLTNLLRLAFVLLSGIIGAVLRSRIEVQQKEDLYRQLFFKE